MNSLPLRNVVLYSLKINRQNAILQNIVQHYILPPMKLSAYFLRQLRVLGSVDYFEEEFQVSFFSWRVFYDTTGRSTVLRLGYGCFPYRYHNILQLQLSIRDNTQIPDSLLIYNY